MNCPKCQHDIATHPANSCLDALFAEKVMDYEAHGVYWQSSRIIWLRSKFSPSTNISHAMEGVEKHKHISFFFDWFPKDKIWRCVCQKYVSGPMAEAEELALAITRALILWAGEKTQ